MATKKMSLKDLAEFIKYSKPKSPPCKVSLIREHLSDDQRAKLDAACELDKGVVTSGGIYKVLADWGFPDITPAAITNHRNGICRCGKE